MCGKPRNGSKVPITSARQAGPARGTRPAIWAAVAEGTFGTQALGSTTAWRLAARYARSVSPAAAQSMRDLSHVAAASADQSSRVAAGSSAAGARSARSAASAQRKARLVR